MTDQPTKQQRAATDTAASLEARARSIRAAAAYMRGVMADRGGDPELAAALDVSPDAALISWIVGEQSAGIL